MAASCGLYRLDYLRPSIGFPGWHPNLGPVCLTWMSVMASEIVPRAPVLFSSNPFSYDQCDRFKFVHYICASAYKLFSGFFICIQDTKTGSLARHTRPGPDNLGPHGTPPAGSRVSKGPMFHGFHERAWPTPTCQASPSLTPLTRFPAVGFHHHHLPTRTYPSAHLSPALTTTVHLLLFLPIPGCRLLEERAHPLISTMFSSSGQ